MLVNPDSNFDYDCEKDWTDLSESSRLQSFYTRQLKHFLSFSWLFIVNNVNNYLFSGL